MTLCDWDGSSPDGFWDGLGRGERDGCFVQVIPSPYVRSKPRTDVGTTSAPRVRNPLWLRNDRTPVGRERWTNAGRV
jgi:hypothetical protein